MVDKNKQDVGGCYSPPLPTHKKYVCKLLTYMYTHYVVLHLSHIFKSYFYSFRLQALFYSCCEINEVLIPHLRRV